MSTKKRVTRRVDEDPVKVGTDRRVSYWTGGKPGVGTRKQRRFKTKDEAEDFARNKRTELARTVGIGRGRKVTLDQLVQDMLILMREVGAPEGTIRQYKSNWNVWVPESVGQRTCIDVDLADWTAIFNFVNKEGGSIQTVQNVARTLGTVIEHGVENGYFMVAEPFAEPRLRLQVVKRAKKRAAIRRAETDEKITLDLCPSYDDVSEYADAFEAVYPGYGRRLVLLAYATGLRLRELLALRAESIDLATGTVSVQNQLDLYNQWPAVRRPKGNKIREAMLWQMFDEVAQSLIDDALAREGEDHGWLFPRHRSTVAWANQIGVLAREARLAIDWDWNFHWLRHGWASVSLAPAESGGYGLDVANVHKWLGHAKPSTTQDMYVNRQASGLENARARTSRRPGEASSGLSTSSADNDGRFRSE